MPQVPSDLPFRPPSSAFLRGRGRSPSPLWPFSGHNDATSMVHYLQWLSWPGALCMDHSSPGGVVSLIFWDPDCSTWHTFKICNLKGLLFLWQNSTASRSLPSPCLSLALSVSPLSYSEFNEGEEIKGSLWFAPDDGEACLFCFCRRSHTASVHVK